MKTLQFDNQTIWYDDILLKDDPKQAFDAEFWRQQDSLIGSAQGRGTTWFVQTQTIQAALRHYRRGGLFGKLIADTYWFSDWEKTRSYQEYDLLNTLIKAGVNVPRPLAARAIRNGLTYKADLLSEKILNARDLVSILIDGPLPEEIYRKIGQEIGKMHHAQVNHTDLNIHNILIGDNDKVWIIDFDKCYQQSGDAWKQSNLDRLKRSFEKEVVRHQIYWHDAELKVLLEGYKHAT
ncbi:3-deoxy-D-manno-octulosonic acid kinase [Vibrio aquimaris]|jgi:3-deoxy-D-manno-octulosonic acid kinase|uniref:3-deoxy-D-manno-octulosonic acid kinase n=1 Tax=Vibrio aquimaris TaxID=2587862 RepID=A0A5P9CFF9_9VIBR|nr:3-deoxy-D-manno-octulosonic acid kinase [Vibrio aquimaris]QFT24990.1 3-deoxy-D-manno-octulosonic acid kinase [Vibrio aquimaris]